MSDTWYGNNWKLSGTAPYRKLTRYHDRLDRGTAAEWLWESDGAVFHNRLTILQATEAFTPKPEPEPAQPKHRDSVQSEWFIERLGICTEIGPWPTEESALRAAELLNAYHHEAKGSWQAYRRTTRIEETVL